MTEQRPSRLPLLVALFPIAICIPSEASFAIGPLTLSVYRVYLMLLFIPSVVIAYSRASRKAVWVDLLMVCSAIWVVISLGRNHGLEVATESGGIFFVEMLAPYFLARAFLRSEQQMVGLARLLWVILCVLAPLMIIESLTGVHVLKQFFATITGKPFFSVPDERFGLQRAFGSFDHPILAGVFAASTIGILWFSLSKKDGDSKGGIVAVCAAIGASVASLSSGALGSMSVQLGLLAWHRIAQPIRRRWLVLTLLSAACYLFIELLSNRTAYQVMISYFTFNPATGYHRLLILEWGFHHNVLREPWFGIGRNDWIRPEWMHSPSVDNFWLFIAMSYGIPAFLFLALASILTMTLGWRGMTGERSRIRMGWTISMFALCIAAITVHYWGSSFVWFTFMLGIGTLWLSDPLTSMSGTTEAKAGEVPARRDSFWR